MIFNSHTHLNTKNLQPDNSMVVSSYKDEWQAVSRFKYFSLGIHPWFINNHTLEDIKLLEQNIIKLKPNAIGECGLDFHINIDKNKQILFFEKQLEMAQIHKIPVIIHVVKSYDETYNILKKYKLKIQIHSFNGSAQQGEKLLALGCYLSFGNYKKSLKLQSFIQAMPIDKILLETDEASGCQIDIIASEIARLAQINLKELIVQTNNNFKKLFI